MMFLMPYKEGQGGHFKGEDGMQVVFRAEVKNSLTRWFQVQIQDLYTLIAHESKM